MPKSPSNSSKPSNPSSSSSYAGKLIALMFVGLVLLAAVLSIWNQRSPEEPEPQAKVDSFASLDLSDPKPSFLLLQYVAEHGGDEQARQSAIHWLNEQTRLNEPLSATQEKWLFEMIENGGHPDWEIGYKLWLFNDSFNCLQMALDQERLTRILLHLALTHESKGMRLYALQHIQSQRALGHLAENLAEEVRASLVTMAYNEQSEVAGTALVNLLAWDDSQSSPPKDLIELALQLAADPNKAQDIRVTALHAIDEHSLDLSRTLATDTAQPVHVRKAAIAWIGRHGTEADIEMLRQLTKENFRIAQAANPALKAIEKRKDGEPKRTLISL